MTFAAALPPNEAERLAQLRELLVLDSPPEALFDRLAALARQVCGTPIGLLSLVDADRQWFKAQDGINGPCSWPRELAFCSHAILSDGVFEVPDARDDPRFAQHPDVVGAPPQLRFYAGAPLVLKPGVRIGTLCVLDHQPRHLTAHQRQQLTALAELACDALRLRRDLCQQVLQASLEHDKALAESERRHRAIVEDQLEMVSLAEQDGRLLYVNPAYARFFGCRPEAMIGQSLLDFTDPADRALVEQHLQQVFASQDRHFSAENRMRSSNGSERWVAWTNRVQTDPQGRRLLHSVGRDISERKALELRLATNERFLRTITDNLPVRISYVDKDGRYRFVNRHHQLRFGRDRGQILGRTRQELVTPDPNDPVLPRFAAALRGEPQRFEHSETISGRRRDIESQLIPDIDDNGQVRGFFATGTDITDRRRIERALAEQHELTRVTLHSIGDAVITTNSAGRVQYMNPVAEQMCGWSALDALGLPLDQVFHVVDQDSRQTTSSPVARCLAENRQVRLSRHAVLLSRQGQEHGIEDSAAPIRTAEGTVLGAVLVFRDVTQQRQLASEMNYRATHDGLTGLVNRVEFELRVHRLLERSRSGGGENALMFIDLDQFKLVNDACGHAAGDQLLRQVATLLQQCVRTRDTLARLGGDEFGVILERCPMVHAQRVAQQICDRMDDFRYLHEGRRFRIGASIGLAPLDARWKDKAAVLQAADSACFAAKDAGRNRVHTWFDADAGRLDRQGDANWINRLEQAMDNNLFELHAQRIAPLDPQAAPAGLYCELLLRLRNEDGSLTPAGAFFPVAERFHMASRIDRWVVRHAFDWLRRRRDVLPHIGLLTINLSGQSVGDRSFHRHLIERLDGVAFAADKLCFEVTETAAITNLGEAADFIAQVRSRGVRIALDDFGAGASSFGYLKTLPVDILKIDGQFIRDLVDDPLDQAAVRCFRDVARVVGVKTVAEFVDREDVRALLREIGIDHAQGYLIHRPEHLDQLVDSCLAARAAATPVHEAGTSLA